MKSLYAGLVEYFPLHEASGTRTGLILGTQMTDNATVTGNPGIAVLASQFTYVNSEYLSVADNANLSTGDIDYTFCAWVYLDDASGNTHTILSKNATSNREYRLQYEFAADDLEWGVSGNGTSFTLVDAGLSSTVASTWYFVRCWHDAGTNVIGIQVNLQTPVTTAHSTGSTDGTAGFLIGGDDSGTPTDFMDGRICEVGFWKRLLTTQEHHWLYNNGLGRTYPFDGRPGVAAMGRNPLQVGSRRNRLTGVIS